MTTRLPQVILIFSTLLASWLGMQAVHELGHVLGAWVSGGRVARVVLHPLTISRTDFAENPSPLLGVWAGPIFGVLAPLLLWGAAVALGLPVAFLFRFFAGFCLLANGLYIGVGFFDRVGDAGDMLRHGAAPWHLWLFGALTAPLGLWLWHRQGSHFGLGAAKGRVNHRVAYGALIVCVLLTVFGFLVDGE
ncbi:MAG: hypothetical protein U0793_19600 [Gemmataceae bacterium]